MLLAILAIVLSAIVVLVGGAAGAAPAATAPATQLHPTASVAEFVHCRRWIPHWHRGGKRHGFGFGCGLKKPKPARRAAIGVPLSARGTTAKSSTPRNSDRVMLK
jgi:hypothetical protein